MTAHRLLEVLRERGLTLAVAEGDTGGLLLAELTSVPGSSTVVLGGVVAYHDDIKRQVLGVPSDLIERHGAVSAEAAVAMARGVRQVCGADVAVASTGIAGPGGATPAKPVGLAFVAAVDAVRCLVREYRWEGDRKTNRHASVRAAIELALELVASIASERSER